MTFAEFERLNAPEGFVHELRHGELVKVAPPKYDHYLIQQLLSDLLDQAAAGAGRAYTELGFRAKPEYEFRIVDVAYNSKERWANARAGPYFLGAPELAVEVLS